MSSTATAPGQAKTMPVAKPVNVLENDVARLVTHLHPVLLLVLFASQFQSLVNDPVSTLLGTALPLSILQTVYLVLCLPGTGKAPPPKRGKGGKRKIEQDWGAKFVPAFLSLVLAVTLGTPLLAITAILFGAPLTTHQPHTLLLALHISLLSSLPLIYVHGIDTQKWLEIASLSSPVDELFGAALGTMIGAWIGAIPIPLDWDREWQKWPVTMVTGAYLGCVAGKVVGGYLLKGRKIKMN